MRNAFTRRICEIALQNKDVIIITNDAPTPAFLEFRQKAPKQFINAGLAEANMTGMAAGLALSGKVVFTYSIIPFVMMRCYEQIRNDVCYQNANVKIIGIGGGICYASLGGTHTALEDVSLMRSIPNMTVISPADPLDALKVADEVVKYRGPVYVRLGRAGEPTINPQDYQFRIGKSVTLRNGKDITVIGYGPVLERALKAAEELEKENVSVRVVNMLTIKPLDEEAIIQAAKQTKALVTIEEHSIIGGIGEAIALTLFQNHLSVPLRTIALKDEFLKIYGKQTDLWELLGFSVNSVKEAIKKTYLRKK